MFAGKAKAKEYKSEDEEDWKQKERKKDKSDREGRDWLKNTGQPLSVLGNKNFLKERGIITTPRIPMFVIVIIIVFSFDAVTTLYSRLL